MFYLKEWALTLWDLRLRGLFFVVSAMALALVLAFRPTLNHAITELAPEAYARPYFTALFDQTVKQDDVMDELKDHAEIAEVQTLTKSEAQGPLGKLLMQLGRDYGLAAGEITSFGVRVILKGAEVMDQAQELRQALESGHGAGHVTLSEIRSPRVAGLFSSHPVFQYLARFGFAGFAGPLFLIWVAAFALCAPHFARRAWLVERFQRRQLVRAKTTAAGLALVVGIAAVVALMLQGPDLIGLGLMLSAFSIPWATSMREVQWRPQN